MQPRDSLDSILIKLDRLLVDAEKRDEEALIVDGKLVELKTMFAEFKVFVQRFSKFVDGNGKPAADVRLHLMEEKIAGYEKFKWMLLGAVVSSGGMGALISFIGTLIMQRVQQ